jgi:NADH:ubiquinone oxidoreductase subunit 6 (subunit J)
MVVEQIIFIIISIITLGGGFGVAVTRNLYYAALYLIMALAGMAGFFVLLGAGFLAAVQVVIYIGAIAVLILFTIMLSRRLMTAAEPQANAQWWLGGIVATLLFVVLVAVVTRVDWPIAEAEPAADTIVQLGVSFLGSYLIPFEVVSILLLVALVGGVILAREVDKE